MPSVPPFVPNLRSEPSRGHAGTRPLSRRATSSGLLCPSVRRSKALPVGGRAHAQASLKEAAKDFGAGEAASLGDGLKLILAILKSTARCIEAGAFYKNAGRRTRFSLEVAD